MSIEALKQTLSDANAALKKAAQCIKDLGDENERLRQAITRAESTSEATVAEQYKKQSTECVEPVGYVYSISGEKIKSAAIDSKIPNGTPLYTHPPVQQGHEPKREWVNATTWRGLTDDEIVECWARPTMWATAHAMEVKLKEKNT